VCECVIRSENHQTYNKRLLLASGQLILPLFVSYLLLFISALSSIHETDEARALHLDRSRL
jgi:hypothetical protein